ncbi:MAG: ABC transporter ATP-binding protein, partial [Verrucomicrobia bacterium]
MNLIMPPEEEKIIPQTRGEPRIESREPKPDALASALDSRPSTPSIPALTVKNLSVYFGKNQVLKGVSLEV